MPAIGYTASSRLAPAARTVAPRSLPPITTKPQAASAPRSNGFLGTLAHAIIRTGTNPGRAITSSAKSMPQHPAAHGRGSQPATTSHQALRQALASAWGGPDRAFLLPTDPILSNSQGLRYSQHVRGMQTQGQFSQDFASLRDAGLLPHGAHEPPMSFPAHGMGAHGGLSYENGGRIFVSPETAAAASDPGSPLHAWGQETLVHELAHALQTPQVLSSVPLREGGAQSFADAVAPRVIGPIPTRDTNYSDYVRGVRTLGAPWFMRHQFRGSSTPPPHNSVLQQLGWF